MTPKQFDDWIESTSHDFAPSQEYREFMRCVASEDPMTWQCALVLRAQKDGQLPMSDAFALTFVAFNDANLQH